MAKISGTLPPKKGTTEFGYLELQVNNGDQPHKILLSFDEILSRGIGGLVAVKEFRGIRTALERIADALEKPQGTE